MIRLYHSVMRINVQTFCLLFCIFLWSGCSSFSDPAALYTYQAPSEENTEWPVSSLKLEKIDTKAIEDLTNSIRTEQYRNIHSLLLIRNGKLVYEEYFNGYTAQIPENIYSASKSITSILTGIAIDKQMIKSTDEKLFDFFPQFTSNSAFNEQKKKITLHHLLTMSSGLACNDYLGKSSPGFEENLNQSNDWIRFTLDLPLAYEPGTTPQYCTAGVITLGGVISKAAGISTEEFAQKYLFAPLGIHSYKWSRMPNQEISTGGKLFIRPRDMAKVGQLVLNKGIWNGQQILSERWITTSTQSYVRLQHFGYGYLWWIQSFTIHNTLFTSYFAWGNGGNFIFILPDYQLVAICTAGNLNSVLSNQFFAMLPALLSAMQ